METRLRSDAEAAAERRWPIEDDTPSTFGLNTALRDAFARGWDAAARQDTQLEQVRRLHEVATERTVRLAAAIERANGDLADAVQSDGAADFTVIVRVRAALADAIRTDEREETDRG